MSRWFRAAKAPASALTADEEDAHLREVEHALLQLLNDDIAQADRILNTGNSAYHHLGRGISSFLASMLGAEKELLKEAGTILHAAENKTWEDMKTAQSSETAFKSQIYPPGTEYLLCYSISQLTSAITAVLSGSVTEAIKGFYKLRKAFLTLDGIMEIESKHLKDRAASRRGSLASRSAPPSRHSTTATPPGSSHDDEKASIEAAGISNGNEHTAERLSLDGASFQPVERVESKLLDIDPASVGITSHTDIFIHSGTRLCYGLLLVVFSMIENPLFSSILSIVGFKGDRERGTRYLWQAARFNNFNSAIAGIALLGYYNGLVGFCDILPTDSGADDDLSGYPKARCRALLIDMRKRYPESKLWKLEEARMHAYDRNLAAAIEILAGNSTSNMQQIAVINNFELSLVSMYFHDYELCAKSWIQCAELSSWSPTLYAYITGTAYLELYRNTRDTDPTAAKVWKDKATEYIQKGPPLAGRQKVMSKQLPFDIYIVRKVSKWEERAAAWNVDLVDAVGVSPLSEMIYFWGGAKKQGSEELQKTLDLLDWSRTGQPEKQKLDLDETAIHSLLRSCFVRNLGKLDEAKEILQLEVLNHERHEFKGHLKDDWALPSANYEMAAIAWREKDLESTDSRAKVLECEQWLGKTKNWGEQYVLDSRMSMKITTSLITINRHKKIEGI